MKKLLILTASLLAATATLRADNDRPIAFSQLPQKAREFIVRYFPDEKVSLAKVERDFFERRYEVLFASSAKVEFYKDGRWKEVDCRYSAMPDGVIPQQIASYLSANYPDTKAVKIDRDNREYEVGLANGMELTFDSGFNLIDIDN